MVYKQAKGYWSVYVEHNFLFINDIITIELRALLARSLGRLVLAYLTNLSHLVEKLNFHVYERDQLKYLKRILSNVNESNL